MAEQVFLASGFTNTTMQMVAERAGASKETLYRHFVSKEGLFAEVIGNRARRLLVQLDADMMQPDAIGVVLRDLGTNLLECMTSPEVVSLLKIVVAEAPRDPGLGQVFYEFGPDRTRLRLTEFLTLAQQRGDFLGSNPSLAASIFLGAITGQATLARLVLETPPSMLKVEIEERVEEVVTMFMQRYIRDAAPAHDTGRI